MKFSKASIIFFLTVISVTGMRCNPAEVVAVRNVIEISSALLTLLDQFANLSKSFKTEVSTLTESTSHDISVQNATVSVAENWQNQWVRIKSDYENLHVSLLQISDTSELFFQELWRTNHKINDNAKRMEDSIQNQMLQERWSIAYNQASQNLENARSLIIEKGNDVEALLQNYAARGQLLGSIDALQTISDEARALSIEIETFTFNVNNIFSLQRTEAENIIACTLKGFNVEHNAVEGAQKGMKIYISFDVANMKDINGKCAIYFYDEDGAELKTSAQNSYSFSDGVIGYLKEFRPGYDKTSYDSFAFFFPYERFNLSDGSYNLKVNAYIFDFSDPQAPKILSQTNFISFTYTQSYPDIEFTADLDL